MWNDGYSKEQPWLNYYNSYERMHCCFGDDGGDGAGGEGTAGDEAASTGTTSLTGAQNAAESKAAFSEALSGAVGSEYYDEERSSEKSALGMNTAQSQQVFDAIDRAAKAGASLTQQQNIAEGGNRAAASGYTGDELGQIADANIDTAFFDDRNTLGIGAGSTSGYGSFADPFAESGVGQTSFGSYINDLKDAGAFAAQNVGVSGLISAVARELGIAPKDVTKEDIDKTQDYSMNRGAESPLEAAAYAAGQRTADPYRDGIAGPAINPMSLAEMAAIEPQNIENPNDNFDKNQETLAGVNVMNMDDFIQQPGYGGAALGGMTDAELQEAFAQEARDMSSARQPDVLGLTTEVDSAENIFKKIIEKPPEEKAVVPKTAMEEYFAKVGTPAIPSSFQEYRSYLPPIGAAANADYRRTLALGTPRYQEPSGPNRSIATLAAAYGLTYDEAAKRFAPPSVPKPLLDKPILFAASGGGLRSLMEYS